MTIKVAAVIGAGVMGSDIALDLSNHKYEVILKDLTDELLEKSRSKIKKSYNFVKMMKKGFFSSSFDELLSRIRFVTDYDNFNEADIVIENITESYEAKKKLYEELRNVCRDDIIFGVDTSCISITKIGALMPRPENVIGMHFMNPAPLKPLVEVVRGYHTSDETVDKTRSFLKSLDKTCVVVSDSPGFASNRVLMLTINESIWLVQDKVAEPKDIDMIFKLGFGHKMGPLATADLIGLDTILDSLVVLYESYNDSKFRPCPLLKKMVDAGLFGMKSGKGFFDYQSKWRNA
ncbi:MAG: 3-hydroxyacyl-CoA dehydrogenase family protein [Planctomycetota bacterium]|jgi:3-hydroxybutyryl-CoA dehydrogenase